jgi:hypothetical protein
LYLSSSWVDYIEGVSNILYTEGASKLGYVEDTSKRVYIKGIYGGIYTISRNKVVYIEFASCRRSALLIAENRLVYVPLKIGAG